MVYHLNVDVAWEVLHGRLKDLGMGRGIVDPSLGNLGTSAAVA